MCEHSASDRGGQEVPTLFEESVRQSACVSSGRGGQEVPTLFEESAWVQCSQLAVCIFSFRPWGVRKSRPFLKNQHVFSMVSLQAHLQTCVNIQLQTGGVRKSRPFLKDQLNSQLACLQAVGVRKSRPFLKNQHGFSAASLHVCISSFRPWGSGSPDPF